LASRKQTDQAVPISELLDPDMPSLAKRPGKWRDGLVSHANGSSMLRWASSTATSAAISPGSG
jgi:hypothetical protein